MSSPSHETAASPPASDIGTVGEDYGALYYREHLGSEEDYSWESPHWRAFFIRVAQRIVALTNPATVLDVGCARGLLVQALVEQGVDAYGIDISEHAIKTADPCLVNRLSVQSATDVRGHWDLITCVEVLEHMSATEAEIALDAICRSSDRVLLSSSPGDFSEPTHVNVRPPAAWAASFAERGFYRRTDVELSFLTPWAVLFQRSALSHRDLVYQYETWAYPLRTEVLEKRSALLAAHQALQAQSDAHQQNPRLVKSLEDERDALVAERDALKGDVIEARQNVLRARDHVIGLEAEVSQTRRKVQFLEQSRDAVEAYWRQASAARDEVIAEMRASASWRVGNRIINLLHWMRVFRRAQ